MLEAITALFVRHRSILKIAEDVFAVFDVPEAGKTLGMNSFSSDALMSPLGVFIG